MAPPSTRRGTACSLPATSSRSRPSTSGEPPPGGDPDDEPLRQTPTALGPVALRQSQGGSVSNIPAYVGLTCMFIVAVLQGYTALKERRERKQVNATARC